MFSADSAAPAWSVCLNSSPDCRFWALYMLLCWYSENVLLLGAFLLFDWLINCWDLVPAAGVPYSTWPPQYTSDIALGWFPVPSYLPASIPSSLPSAFIKSTFLDFSPPIVWSALQGLWSVARLPCFGPTLDHFWYGLPALYSLIVAAFLISFATFFTLTLLFLKNNCLYWASIL